MGEPSGAWAAGSSGAGAKPDATAQQAHPAHTSSTHPAKPPPRASTQMAQNIHAPSKQCEWATVTTSLHFAAAAAAGRLAAGGWGRAHEGMWVSRQAPTASTQLRPCQRNRFQQRAAAAGSAATGAPSPGLLLLAVAGAAARRLAAGEWGQGARGRQVESIASGKGRAGADRVSMTGDRQPTRLHGMLAPSCSSQAWGRLPGWSRTRCRLPPAGR